MITVCSNYVQCTNFVRKPCHESICKAILPCNLQNVSFSWCKNHQTFSTSQNKYYAVNLINIKYTDWKTKLDFIKTDSCLQTATFENHSPCGQLRQQIYLHTVGDYLVQSLHAFIIESVSLVKVQNICHFPGFIYSFDFWSAKIETVKKNARKTTNIPIALVYEIIMI